MTHLRTLLTGLIGFFALWSLWGFVLRKLGLTCVPMCAWIAFFLTVGTAWLALVQVEGKASSWGTRPSEKGAEGD